MANTLVTVEQRLNADPSYREQFAQAWGQKPITYEMVEKSIASFRYGDERIFAINNHWKYKRT